MQCKHEGIQFMYNMIFCEAKTELSLFKDTLQQT